MEKTFGRHRVLNGVSCRVPRGQITAIIGPTGVGKSVLLRHFAGLLMPDRGKVLLNGISVPMLGEEELTSVRRNVGMLFQDGPLFGSMTLYDNVAFPLRWHTGKSEREIREIATAWLVEVGLAGCEGRRPHELSVDVRKRAGLARALVLEPKIVLLDDPDDEPAALLWELIREIQRRHESTAVVAGRDKKAVLEIADRVILLRGGRVIDQGSKERLGACR